MSDEKFVVIQSRLVPKTMMSFEFVTFNAQDDAIPEYGLGSQYRSSMSKGVGTAGLGWK
jgi:hypothetical protein